jgi:hypothetical protein
MVAVENVQVLTDDSNSLDFNNVTEVQPVFEVKDLTDEPWDAQKNTNAAVSYPLIGNTAFTKEQFVFRDSIDTSRISPVLAHSTPAFNFKWELAIEKNNDEDIATQPTAIVTLLFYPNPYFDQRY